MKNLPNEAIRAEYLSGISESALAEKFKVGRGAIRLRLLATNTPIRSERETRLLYTQRSFCTTFDLEALVDGLLLGDGWLEVNQNSEGRLCLDQRDDRNSWLDMVEKELLVGGVRCSRSIRLPRTACIDGRDFVGRGALSIRTMKYTNFTKQRHRWYPNGEKIVPKDVNLSPRSLAHWYWGDGATTNDGYRMIFHTEGFAETDVVFLRDRLEALYGWTPTIQRRTSGKFILVIQRKEQRRELAATIKPFCPPCFDYKLIIKE